MGDHVVQLACDAQPFGGHGLGHLLRAQFGRVLPALAEPQAGHVDGAQGQEGDQARAHQVVRSDGDQPDRRELHDEHRDQSDDRVAPGARSDDESEDEVRGEEDEEPARTVVPGRARDERAAEEGQGQCRQGPVPQQGNERGHGQQHHGSEERPGGVRDTADQQAQHEGVEGRAAPGRAGRAGPRCRTPHGLRGFRHLRRRRRLRALRWVVHGVTVASRPRPGHRPPGLRPRAEAAGRFRRR